MGLIILAAIAVFLFWLFFIEGFLWRVVVGAVAWVGIFGVLQAIIGPIMSATVCTALVVLAFND